MKWNVLLIAVFLVAGLLFTIDYVSAASITATISAQVGGVEVTQAPQGTTIQLVSSCSVTPPTPVTGTVSYEYSADGVTWDSKTTIATYLNWDGAEQSTDFVLDNAGSYIFYIDVITDGPPPRASATQYYPSAGVFASEEPPTGVSETPPVAIFALSFAAIGLFAVVAKRKTRKP